MNNRNKQQGFTLIELLVVVSILASLAGLTSVAMDGYQKDSEETITRVEMQRISNAIRRFKADTGYWPKTETAPYAYKNEDSANFSFLFNNPGDELTEWTPEYAIGWHGPYVDLPAIKAIAIDTFNSDLGCSGNGDSTHVAAVQVVAISRMNGLIDRFQQLRERNTGERYCMLIRDDKNPTEFTVTKYSGSPYLYEADYSDANNALCSGADECVALRSFGADGVDNNGIDTSDDIVFVLQVN
jgi:prepilin-type N-terminal cleavage/methylation domain-containing protein